MCLFVTRKSPVPSRLRLPLRDISLRIVIITYFSISLTRLPSLPSFPYSLSQPTHPLITLPPLGVRGRPHGAYGPAHRRAEHARLLRQQQALLLDTLRHFWAPSRHQLLSIYCLANAAEYYLLD
jgi:hypothetical protein